MCASLLSTVALGGNAEQTFEFKFYGSNIFPWIDGSKSGLVTDEKGDMANGLERMMASSTRYLDAAVYGINAQDWFFQQLANLKNSDVRVRTVVDQMSGFLGEWEPHNFAYRDTVKLVDTIGEAAIQVDVGRDGNPRAGSIMHNKFVVADNTSVWMGSTNISSTGLGAEYNANTSLEIKSPKLARIYSGEFRKMFSLNQFSLYKNPRSNRTPLTYGDGTEVSVFFSPQDNTLEAAVLPFIDSTQHRLAIGMFYLTDHRIVAALVRAQNRGVDVRLIYDGLAASHPSSKIRELRAAGVNVRIENWGGKMHMKTAIADSKNVLIGSMNWSMSGSRTNDENTLIIKNNRKLARSVTIYFNKLWKTLDNAANMPDPRAESLSSINSCFDGIDNNHNGLVDAEEPSCSNSY